MGMGDMTCETIILEDGFSGIVCHRERRMPKCSVKGCPHDSVYQCDALVPRRKSGTCDKHLCAQHRTQIAGGVDFCPKHADTLVESLI
jgi:hypothetical protein